MVNINKNEIETQLLSIVRDFVSEFKSERAKHSVNINAHLERDLGIDSLGRVELFLRIEKAFDIQFPETFMAEAETLQDIVNGIIDAIQTGHQGRSHEKLKPREFVGALEQSHSDPSSKHTLLDVLLGYAEADPKRPHIYLSKEDGQEEIIRYGDLLENAKKVASGLLALNLKRSETVAIMLPTSPEFFYAFFGILLAGGIPVPIYPPIRADKIEEYAAREAKILNNAEVKILITFSQAEALGKLLRIFIRSLTSVATVPELMNLKSTRRMPSFALQGEEPAMIQYTSGSTSDPKGVLLSHDNLLANVRASGTAISMSAQDVGVSWLPLYHDMGLIGAWFSSLYYGFPLTVMSPLTFLSRPARWLWAIHYHRGTLSAGPNFAYELCIRKIQEEDIVGLDLSSWRLAFNGAEAINPRTIERFTRKFEPYGFKPEAFFPVYGLAECSVALCFPELNQKPKVDVILRVPFEAEQKAVPANKSEMDVLEFVSCGKPIPLHEIRIVNDNNEELEERQVGTLHFTGPSAMQGYYQNNEATKAVYHEGWWDTGDFAYIAEGNLYITGRKKDIIIKAGRNIYPQEIEEVTAEVPGVRKGCVVAFGMSDPKWGTEKLIVVAESTENQSKILDRLAAEINDKVSVVLGIPPDQVVLVPPRTIPKTSSGKLQRAACKTLYKEGKLMQKSLPVWLQITKLYLQGVGIQIYNWLKKFGYFLYTFYVAILLVLIMPFALIALFLTPKNIALNSFRILSRILIWLAGLKLIVRGKGNLKQFSPMVYVANHASYVDSLILLALLPKNTLFVGKKELKQWPLVGAAFKKLGFLTVDRIDFAKNLSDTDLISDAINKENSILIYPEGTFTYATGLRPFKTGAFKVAVDTNTPVCPIALKGTRTFMRGENIILKPTSIEINIGDPIVPASKDWSEVTRLHSLARVHIEKYCGELAIDILARA